MIETKFINMANGSNTFWKEENRFQVIISYFVFPLTKIQRERGDDGSGAGSASFLPPPLDTFNLMPRVLSRLPPCHCPSDGVLNRKTWDKIFIWIRQSTSLIKVELKPFSNSQMKLCKTKLTHRPVLLILWDIHTYNSFTIHKNKKIPPCIFRGSQKYHSRGL